MRITTPPRSTTTEAPAVSTKTPPSNVNLPPLPPAQRPRMTTTTTSTTSSTTPSTTILTTTSTTTTTTPRPTTPRGGFPSIGFKFNPSDSFRSIYVGSPNNTKIFLPQIKFMQPGRLVSLEVIVQFHIMIPILLLLIFLRFGIIKKETVVIIYLQSNSLDRK